MAPNLPQSFKVGIFEEKDAPLRIKEIPLEHPKAGEVLIKTLACGVCHSDVVVGKGLFGNPLYASHRLSIIKALLTVYRSPIIPGHEVIGNVVEVGEDEKVWKVGDRVGGPWHGGHCGITLDWRFKVHLADRNRILQAV